MSSLIENRRLLRSKYPEFVDSTRHLNLAPENVPESLRPYIAYAEIWGISDDGFRMQLVGRAPEAAKADLRTLMASIEGNLNQWLGGPASYEVPPSSEYIAFSAMRMAADFL